MKHFVLFFVILIISLSCSSPEDCDLACKNQSKQIMATLSRASILAERANCNDDINKTKEYTAEIESIIDHHDDPRQIATLASIFRSFQIYQSNEVPTCRLSKPNETYDRAFWACIIKLSKNKDKISSDLIPTLIKHSELTNHEREFFDDIKKESAGELQQNKN